MRRITTLRHEHIKETRRLRSQIRSEREQQVEVVL
jgi:hypothetical protein